MAPSCTVLTEEIEGVSYPRIRYDAEGYSVLLGGAAVNCNDCGVHVGGLHHPNCDMEQCPRCDGQRIACGCPRES